MFLENPSLPTGIVTFLFTDIQGSTSRWESQPEQMSAALQIHNTELRQAIGANGGIVFKTVGDAIQAVFPTATQAIKAAVDGQRGLQSAPWGHLEPLKVRMGLHAGEAEIDPGGDEYAVSHTKNRVARIMSAGHGDQILISTTVADLLPNLAAINVTLRDLGEHHLKGMLQPEHLFQVNSPGLPDRFPALKTSDIQSNLPIQPTPFFGREAELARIETLLGDPECRIITLVGIGGTGKSRLAIEAARRSTAFEGDVYFVGLAYISSHDDLIIKIAESIQYAFYNESGANLPVQEAQSQLLHYLADQKALLVLDNFEQLMQFADFLFEILSATRSVKLLVTSRERLNLPGEWVVELGGLSFPEMQTVDAIPGYAAVQLFIQTAERTGAYTVSPQDYATIAHICRMLEGMPLGIEMAAASARLLSCAEIAHEIEQNLDFLAATWRQVPERHHTLRAVFEASWRLLTVKEQNAFIHLAIFRGGFNRDAAAKVASLSFSMLSNLVNKSLLRRIASGRYEIHPVLKPYAIEKLFNDPAAQMEARSQHAFYFADWLSGMFEALKGENQLAALTALRAEVQDLRAAFQTLMEQQEYHRLDKMYPAFILFFEMNDQRVETQETLALLEVMEKRLRQNLAVNGSSGSSTTRDFNQGLLALTLSAMHHFSLDPKNPQIERLRESLELLENLPDSEIKAYSHLLNCRGPGLESDQKLDLCQHSYRIFKSHADPWGAALAQLIWADEMNFSGFDVNLARVAYLASQEAFFNAKSQWGHALCLFGLMELECKEGHFEEAYRLGNHSLEHFRALENFERVAWVNHRLAELSLQRERPEDARRHFEANLSYFSQQGDRKRQQYYQDQLKKLEIE
jgi:predicted ATPase/class 3 adenylate cyclase